MATITAAPTAAPEKSEIRRRVRNLALPAVGEQLLNTAVGLADVFLIGNMAVLVATQLGYSSATALTAAGLGHQMIWLVTVLMMAVGVGSTALIARAVGARQEHELGRILRQSFVLATIVGVVATIFALVVAEPFLRLLRAPEEVIPLGVSYIQICAWAFLPASLLFVGSACLRGAGDTRTPLYIMLGVNVANVVLSWLLINGNLGLPALGVAGAAIGTAIARIGGGVALTGLLLRGHSGLKLVLEWRPDREMLDRIVKIGLPTAGEMMVFQAAMMVFVPFVTTLGTVAYAAHNVVITIESVSFLPGMGYAAATSALVGQALGARQKRLAVDYAYEALRQGGLMMTLAGLVMVIFPATLVGWFINDPAVIDVAIAPMRAAGLVQLALAVSFILLGALRGAGDTRYPLYARIMTTWVIRMPLVFLLVGYFELGLAGIWLAMCTDFTLQALLVLWRFRRGKWQQIKV